jgi:hypothetical protein
MARGRKKTQKGARAGLQPVAPQLIYQARLGINGAVIRVQPPINQAQAIAIRRNDGNVVVCGPDKTANSVMARDILQAASGHWKRCKPHINAGPNALPHYQPDPRGQTTGHTFYETDTKYPL